MARQDGILRPRSNVRLFLGHIRRGIFVTRARVCTLFSGILLATGAFSGCGGSSDVGMEPGQALSVSPGTSVRSLAPEQSGPVATITPTPVGSPQEFSQSPAITPTPMPSSSALSDGQEDAADPPVVVPKPQKSKKPAKSSPSNCDPNYSGACVPIVGWDLDCPDIGANVTVEGADIHRFDADGDGSGCESY